MRTTKLVLGSLIGLTIGASLSNFAFGQTVQETFDKIDRLQKQGPSLQRAMNLARTKAVSLNGGLSNYVPAACMFSTSLVRQSCLIQADDLGFVFKFSGGRPGWQVQGVPPTVKTEVSISADGKTLLNIRNVEQ
jgi:hypothetical protein